MTGASTPLSASQASKRVIVRRPAADVRAASIAALQRGAVIIAPLLYPESAGTRIEWDISARCQRPIEIVDEGEGHYQPSPSRAGLEWQSNRTLAKLVPCRRCPSCLRARQRAWTVRAVREVKHAESRGLRTWAGTLTFNPHERYRMLSRTRSRLDAHGIDLASLHPDARFREQHRDLGPLVSKFLRSLRKGRKKLRQRRLFFRYFLTVEPHKDGTPHYHLVVHEISDLAPIPKQTLEASWRKHGFSHWRLIREPRQAAYAAKYLGKGAAARVRASKAYGAASATSPEVPQKF